MSTPGSMDKLTPVEPVAQKWRVDTPDLEKRGWRVCVVGAGRWGRGHVQALQELGYLEGIVEPDAVTRAELTRLHPSVQLFATLDDALVEDFDGFTVATPAETHYNIGRRLLSRKKHVLIETPLALTSEEALHLKTLAEQHHVHLMAGHTLLFHPAIQRITTLIDKGTIGPLQYMHSHRIAPEAQRPGKHGLWGFSPNDLAVFQFLIGRYPSTVMGHGGAPGRPGEYNTTVTMLTYPNGVMAHSFVSWLHPVRSHRLVVVGVKGMLLYDEAVTGGKVFFYEKSLNWISGEPIPEEEPTAVFPCADTPSLVAELQYFVEHFDARTSPSVNNPQSAVDVLEIIESAARCETKNSAYNGKQRQETTYQAQTTSIVEPGASIGEHTQIGHFSHIQAHAQIGAKCTLGQNVHIGEHVQIGNHVKIQDNVTLFEGVELEDYVYCGPSMVFTNVIRPRSKHPRRGRGMYEKTLVRTGASISANATILCGITIGRYAMVGVGAVVTTDVSDYALMMGAPAQRVGWVCECGEVLADSDDKAVCRQCGLHYQCKNGQLFPVE